MCDKRKGVKDKSKTGDKERREKIERERERLE